LGDLSLKEIGDGIAAVCWQDDAIIAAYLFGSYAKGSPRAGSDLDIAVLVKEASLNSFSLLSFSVLLHRICNREADVVLLNRAGELLKREVRRTGILVFERDAEARKRFEIMGRKSYEDFLHLHRRYAQRVLYRQ
jgi:predicted nucleotidyltransferase